MIIINNRKYKNKYGWNVSRNHGYVKTKNFNVNCIFGREYGLFTYKKNGISLSIKNNNNIFRGYKVSYNDLKKEHKYIL